MDWGNKQQVLARVAQNGDELRHASEELKRDRTVVMAAVTQNGDVSGDTLEYASDEFKNDKAVVMAAVTRWGTALQYDFGQNARRQRSGHGRRRGKRACTSTHIEQMARRQRSGVGRSRTGR